MFGCAVTTSVLGSLAALALFLRYCALTFAFLLSESLQVQVLCSLNTKTPSTWEGVFVLVMLNSQFASNLY